MSGLEHWSDRYVGTPYSEADCAELCADVRRQVFGQNVWIPTERADSPWGRNAQIEQMFWRFVQPFEREPRDGDVALLVCSGRLRHVGTLCVIGRHRYVLHALRGAGEAVRARVVDLPQHGIYVEGYYEWQP